jgi:hypothetical protein
MRRLLRILVALLLAGLMCLLLVCWSTGIWSYRQLEVYQAMSRECHPVWHDLWNGRIREGDDIERVIERTTPRLVERHGPFVDAVYQVGFTGLSITAIDGRVVSASSASCTWSWVFFDGMSDRERADWAASTSVHLEKRWKEREKE